MGKDNFAVLGRPLQPLTVSPEDREKLRMLAARPRSSQAMATRARIILLCEDGYTNSEVAIELGVSRPMIGKWRERFRVHGLQGLLDEPRLRAPRKVSDEWVERVLSKTLEETPRGQTHWSRRTMAKEVGLSRETIGRIWSAFGLQPHRVETFKLSPDPQYIEKVRDVVGLYMNPPENAVVLCIDEKSQIQALERKQPILPLRPGVPERQTHDYKRNGTTTLFAALNVHTGKVVRQCFARHRSQEYMKFLRQVDASLEQSVAEVHIVVDNYATHKTPAVQRWLAKHPRFVVHFTPTYASWLNLVERLFGEITDRAIRRGSFPSVASLKQAIEAYLDARDDKPFVWTATADNILRRTADFCKRTTVSGH